MIDRSMKLRSVRSIALLVAVACTQISAADDIAQMQRHALTLHNGSPTDRVEAVSVRKNILAAVKQTHGDAHPEVVEALNRLASAQATIKQYRDAGETQHEALSLCRKLYPPSAWPDGAVQTAQCAIRMAQYQLSSRNRNMSLRFLREAGSILDRSQPAASFDLAYARMELGFLYINVRDTRRARLHCLKAIELVRMFDQKQDVDRGRLAVVYGKCAFVLSQSLDLELARQLGIRALAETEQQPPEHVHTIKSHLLRMLGNICRDLGEYEQAADYLDRAYQLMVKTKDKATGRLTVETAICHLAAGDLKASAEWVEKARLWHDLEPRSRNWINVIQGQIDLQQGDVPAAMQRFETALSHVEPHDRRLLSQIKEALAAAAAVQGDSSASANWLEKAVNHRASELSELIPAAGEAYALKLLADNRRVCEKYLFATRSSNSPDQVRSQYSLVMRHRGLAGRVIAVRNRLRHQLQDEAARVYRDYIAASDRLSQASSAATGANAAELAGMTSHVQLLEQRLEEHVPDLIDTIRQLHVPITTIRDALADDEILVDFVRYESEGQCSYAAFVMSKERIDRVEISNADQIEDEVLRWRQRVGSGKYDRETAVELYQRLWQPISHMVKDETSTIHICADGNLSLLPWNALMDESGGVLLEKYLITRPPTAHALLERRRQIPKSGRLLAVGNIDYGNPVPHTADSKQIKVSHVPLVHSAEELDCVVRSAKSASIETVRLEQKEATVDTVAGEMPASRWIHLATHGGYWPSESNKCRAYRSPMSDCRLVLADANVKGGLTSGTEICNYNLHATELVFLSTCESGVGELVDGEGVLGLQRAFHHAGVQNVVCSIWKVDDAATAVLVDIFWQKYWQNGRSAARALREAQLEIYQNPLRLQANSSRGGPKFKVVPSESESKPTSPPLYWAGFVFSGVDGRLSP